MKKEGSYMISVDWYVEFKDGEKMQDAKPVYRAFICKMQAGNPGGVEGASYIKVSDSQDGLVEILRALPGFKVVKNADVEDDLDRICTRQNDYRIEERQRYNFSVAFPLESRRWRQSFLFKEKELWDFKGKF